jgi:hypothetical protein
MWVALVAVAVVLGLAWLGRQRELFVLSVRDGRVLVVRGRIPGGLLADVREACAPVRRGLIVAYRDDDGAALDLRGGIDPGRAQRLRNIFALYPMSRLRAASPAAERSLGQLLGVVWLAWLLERRP